MAEDNKPNKETLDNWHNDPNNWKFGFLYFNQKDKRIFPPKRNERFGWTVNFANPFSILAMVLIITLAIIVTKIKNK